MKKILLLLGLLAATLHAQTFITVGGVTEPTNKNMAFGVKANGDPIAFLVDAMGILQTASSGGSGSGGGMFSAPPTILVGGYNLPVNGNMAAGVTSLGVPVPILCDDTGAVVISGGGGGTPGGSTTQMQYNNAGAFGGTSAITYSNSTGDLTTTGKIWIGGNTTQSNDSWITIDRAVNDSIAGNGHAFSDSSVLTRGGGIAYNSFDGRIVVSGSANYNHYAGFQASPDLVGSGTITSLYGFETGAVLETGTITSRYGFYVFDAVPSGAATGTIGTQYGLYVAALSHASTNWGVYVAGNDSYFNGNITLTGSITAGSGGTVAGYVALGQGTAPSAGTTNITLYAPASVTSYRMLLPGAAGTGLYLGTNSAGIVTLTQVAAPTGTIVGTSDTQTLTNKRVTARVTTITSNATPTVNTDNCDIVSLTAQAAAITSMSTNLTGTPQPFDQLEYSILDNGTARAITWNSSGSNFTAGPVALPTTTTLSKTLHVYFERNAGNTTWVCMSSSSDL